LLEEEKLDGYYAIVTSELKRSDKEICNIYKGRWQIEDAFRVTKSDLEARPVFLSRNDRIEAHFLICFTALIIIRLLALNLNNKHSPAKIIDSLKRASGSLIEENWYLFNYTDEVLEDISTILGLPLQQKYVCLGDLKKIFGHVKK
jgi:transposase